MADLGAGTQLTPLTRSESASALFPFFPAGRDLADACRAINQYEWQDHVCGLYGELTWLLKVKNEEATG